MLKVINPKDQHCYRGSIDLFMGMLECFQEVPLIAEEQEISIFIIGETKPVLYPKNSYDEDALLEDGIYGGAILYQRSAREIPPAFQRLMAVPNQETVWESTTCLFSTPQRLSLNRDEPDGCQTFYKELLEKFIEFGQHLKINFLCFTLCPFEYQRTKNKGFWPYVLEISPEESPDGLFHGILCLSKDLDKKKRPHYKRESVFPQASLAAA